MEKSISLNSYRYITIQVVNYYIYMFFQEKNQLREAVPDNNIASLQEELAAAKLREAEGNLALKDLKAKVAELSAMWQKHLKRNEEALLNQKKFSQMFELPQAKLKNFVLKEVTMNCINCLET